MALHLELGEVIAKGGHSVIYVAREANSDQKVALKVFRDDHNGRKLCRNETRIMQRLPGHVSLPKLLGAGDLDGNQFIAMQYFPSPSLSQYMQVRGSLPESEALFVLQQLLDVMQFLQDNGVAHRDIKPENILIDPATLRIVLIDFGLAASIVDEHMTDTHPVGTPVYMAPQIVAKRPYKIIASDIWSSGITFWELVAGRHPFYKAKGQADLADMLKRGLDFTGFQDRSRYVLERLLEPAEFMRPSLRDARRIVQEASQQSSATPFSSTTLTTSQGFVDFQFEPLLPQATQRMSVLPPPL